MIKSNIKIKHFISKIRSNWNDRWWWNDRLVDVLAKILFRENDGFFVLKEEWDNLIILDACRYDLFERKIREWKLKGKLEYRISRGGGTVEFLSENFNEGFSDLLRDIIYITSTPHVNRHLRDTCRIVSVWKSDWNNKLNTVPPDAVYYKTLKILKKYEDSRLIVHFLQPHYPFLSLCTKNIDIRRKYGILAGINTGESAYRPLQKGEMSLNLFWKYYEENLESVMYYVNKLIRVMRGKVVVTADHGEALGEKIHPLVPIKVYGHPGRVRIECLIKVPWFIARGRNCKTLLEKELIKYFFLKKKKDLKLI